MTTNEIFEVEMLAFGGQPAHVLKVVVDTSDIERFPGLSNRDALEEIFICGQTDFQLIKGPRSVTAGDVIRFRGKRYKVLAMGFKEVSQ